MNLKARKTNVRAVNAEDVKVHASSGNVFADLGLPDAGERLTKAQLANEICSLIKSAKLTQTQAARRLGVDQPKVSALMRGQLKEFSIERLIRFATRLGRDVLIHVRTPERSGHASVRVLVEI